MIYPGASHNSDQTISHSIPGFTGWTRHQNGTLTRDANLAKPASITGYTGWTRHQNGTHSRHASLAKSASITGYTGCTGYETGMGEMISLGGLPPVTDT